MNWTPYGIDDCAQRIVLQAIRRDPSLNSLNQVFKMRTTCSYGLERFWGEFLRLNNGNGSERLRSEIILDTWVELKDNILKDTGISLPYDPKISISDKEGLIRSLRSVWEIRTQNPKQAQVVLSVLLSLCDAIVWWKNRLAPGSISVED